MADFRFICDKPMTLYQNICFFTRELPLGSYTGGMGVYIYNLALGLSELGNRVNIITIEKMLIIKYVLLSKKPESLTFFL